jgi:universal stress protein A
MLPLRRMLCPIDFSDFSYLTLTKAGELASHFGAELCVLHVTQPTVTTAYPSVGYIRKLPAYEKAAREAAEQEMKDVLQRYSFPNVRVRLLTRIGHPPEQIVRAAEEEKVDLIIIPTHGFTGWRQYVFGSVAESVLRMAHCPVLLQRIDERENDGFSIPPRKILCSTDFSEPSYAALRVAGEWAAHFGAELGLIHVVKPPGAPGMVLWREQIEEDLLDQSMQQLQHVLQKHVPQLGKAAYPLVRTGSAADEIAGAIAEENTDLLIMATSGANYLRSTMVGTPIERLLFGSVATNVVRLTSCPILTVRLPLNIE